MFSDIYDSNYTITLQDVDGITINGVNYKINGGNKISLEVIDFSMSFPIKVGLRERNNVNISATNPYSEVIGAHTINGAGNIVIEITGIIWIDDAYVPRNNIGTPISIPILNDIRMYNHRLYLKDYHGSSSSVVTPINALGTRPDLRGIVPLTSNGLPVVVTKIENIRRGNDTEKGAFITYSMTLEEDRV